MKTAVLVAVVALTALAGCIHGLPDPYGGEKLIQGYVDEAWDFDRVDPGVPYFQGWRGQLHVGALTANRNMEPQERCLALFVDVNSRERPDLYENLSRLADQQGRFAGAYIEFRGRTIWDDGWREGIRLTELVRLEPAPAGPAWRDAQCPAPADFLTHGD